MAFEQVLKNETIESIECISTITVHIYVILKDNVDISNLALFSRHHKHLAVNNFNDTFTYLTNFSSLVCIIIVHEF